MEWSSAHDPVQGKVLSLLKTVKDPGRPGSFYFFGGNKCKKKLSKCTEDYFSGLFKILKSIVLIILIVVSANCFSVFAEDSSKLIEEGKKLLRQQNYEEALKFFEQAVLQSPNNVEAHYYRGVTLYELKKYSQANETFNFALNLDKDNYLLWFYKGKTLNAMHSFKEALGCFEKSIEIKPDFEEAWILKGMVLYASENYRQCIASMLKVTSMNANNAQAWVFIGMSNYMLGDYEKAKTYILKGIYIDPLTKSNVPVKIRKDLDIQ